MSQKYEHFGKYILLEKLAAGGMAEVFLARSLGAGGIAKFVAIKRILPQFSDNPEFISMFKDEAKIAINLSHSNVVNIYEFGVEKSQFFIVMDYVEGRNLRQILNKMKKTDHKLSIEQIIYIVKEITSGLDHAHRGLDGTTGKPLNITHRDMSPQNVMISFEGEIKIIDFGIAKTAIQIGTTQAGTLKGKFGYMSPEQAEGQTVDLRTDIFSLGIVLWELLAEARLFIANNEINTLRKIRECHVPSLHKINPNIPTELERIVNKALARDKNQRYQTATAIHRDLNRFLNRQFPDFSTHDYAVFIKSLYADEILQTRQHLIQYAQIDQQHQRNNPSHEDNTGDLEMRTKSLLAPEKNDLNKTNTFVSEIQKKKNKALQTEKSLSGIIDTSLVEKDTVLLKEIKLHPTSTHKSINEKIRLPQTSTSNTKNRYVDSSQTYAKSERNFSFLSSLLLLSILVGSFLLLIEIFPHKMAPLMFWVDTKVDKKIDLGSHSTSSDKESAKASDRPQRQPAPKPKRAYKKTVASKKTVGLIIKSKPSGAQIYINGKNSGKITPSRVEIPRNRKFSLNLVKSGYIKYTRTRLSFRKLKKRSLSATLKKALIGYLDIDVIPPKNARVYINGRLLRGKRLPITRYAVPASHRIKVTAKNPYNKTFAQKIIRLNQHQRKSIVLQLKHRRSSSKRQPAPKPKRTYKKAVASKKIVGLIIKSKPSGAQIYINGKNSGKITPSRVEVPRNRKFSLNLVKSGYIKYTRTRLSFRKLKKRGLSATLQKVLIGYLDIKVNPPKNARVYINGKLLRGKRLPITRYAVPASHRIKVTAKNPYNKTFAQKIIRLNQHQRKSIVLQLKRRRPSSK